jgi:hypothetical protein
MKRDGAFAETDGTKVGMLRSGAAAALPSLSGAGAEAPTSHSVGRFMTCPASSSALSLKVLFDFVMAMAASPRAAILPMFR